ncbi:hypothetical protein Taro_031454 [Colocasia esculenta]|uniref:Uncharacterized protein n=1 Tax=Colocasia esculenta TaxID=4460 RepID=A0A843W370_COLES|nr:hypothetical protein [Colocasia esculenta]
MSGLTPVRVRRRPPNRDCPICRLLGSDCDSLPVATKKATGKPSRSQYLACKPCRYPYMLLSRSAWYLSRSLQPYVAFTVLALYPFLATAFALRYSASGRDTTATRHGPRGQGDLPPVPRRTSRSGPPRDPDGAGPSAVPSVVFFGLPTCRLARPPEHRPLHFAWSCVLLNPISVTPFS